MDGTTTTTTTTTTRPPIPSTTAEDQARRQQPFDYGRASVGLECLIINKYAEDLNRRHIAGEITSAQRSAAIRTHHGL